MAPVMIVDVHFIVPRVSAPLEVLLRLANHVADCGLWLDYCAVSDAPELAISSGADLARLTAAQGSASASRLATADSSASGETGGLIDWLLERLEVDGTDGVLVAHRQQVPLPTTDIDLKDVTRFFHELRPAIASDLVLGNAHHVWISDLEFAVPRPPPAQPEWTMGPMYVLDDRRDYDGPESQGEWRAEYRALALPPNVRRTSRNDITIDVWLDDLSSLDRISTMLSDQSAWLAEHLGLPPRAGWNAHGDRQVPSYNLETAQPWLTFYEPRQQRGLKGTVPIDGRLDAEALAEALRLLEAGELPDGRPLDRVDLIFPTRETAVALRPEAKKLGFARTLWVDNDGRLWNIHPLGVRWRP